MKTAFVILFLLLFFLTSTGQERGCFSKNGHGLALETNIDFSRYRAFYVGEFHGIYGLPEIKLALIEFLQKNYGIRDVFMEISFSSAWLYNRYLETGDTTLFSSPQLVYAMKQVNHDFWKHLYTYNKNTDQKITIHGMDFERMDFLKVMKLLMPKGKDKPGPIAGLLTFIDTLKITDVNYDIWAPTHRGQMFSQLYDSIRRDFKKNRDIYEQYYGPGFHVIEKIMTNKNTYLKYAESNKSMYRNMMEEIRENHIGKFITFNGLAHGNKSYGGWRSLCYRLAQSKPFRHKLATVAMLCKNCYDWQLQPQFRAAAYRAPFTYQDDTLLMRQIFDNIYQPECTYTLAPSEEANNRKVVNFSDYLILIKDQPEF